MSQEATPILFPGVPVPCGPVTIEVFPVAYNHLPRFAGAVTRLVDAIARASAAGSGQKLDRAGVISVLLPLVLQECLPLLDECCVPKPSVIRLPQKYVPAVIKSWLEQTIAEDDSFFGWGQLMEAVTNKLGGNNPILTDALSRPSSAPDTDLQTSAGSSSAA